MRWVRVVSGAIVNRQNGISVIIPVGAEDDSWKQLLTDLCFLSPEDEIILSAASSLAVELKTFLEKTKLPCACVAINRDGRRGRAKQLNDGASAAKNDFFWFLHSDSRISSDSFKKLRAAIVKNSNAVYFFDLLFLDDGPIFMKLNTLGTWFRSQVLRLPFGDQGFCIKRTNFYDLGKFNESAIYGEDHLFVWKAHQKRIPLNSVGAHIKTSARKYRINGWGKTTKLHILLTLRQALPELRVFLKQRDL